MWIQKCKYNRRNVKRTTFIFQTAFWTKEDFVCLWILWSFTVNMTLLILRQWWIIINLLAWIFLFWMCWLHSSPSAQTASLEAFKTYVNLLGREGDLSKTESRGVRYWKNVDMKNGVSKNQRKTRMSFLNFPLVTCHSVACCSILIFPFKEHICLFLFSWVILYPFLKLYFHSKEFGNTYRYIFSKSVHNHLKVCFWVFLLEYILNDFLIDVYSMHWNLQCWVWVDYYNVDK